MGRPVSLERALACLQLSASTIVLSPCTDRKIEKQAWKALEYKLASHVSTYAQSIPTKVCQYSNIYLCFLEIQAMRTTRRYQTPNNMDVIRAG